MPIAGHPEHEPAIGIETTTGPLGQGLANAVGMALAEKLLAAQFNQPGLPVVDHRTYVFVGDGCLMEGISHEACSLAGTLGLGKLTAVYDDNGISIDGDVRGWFRDDTPGRFEAYGWQVIRAVDGQSADAVAEAFRVAQADTERPTLICCKTVIGFGSPNRAGTKSAHGEALGVEEVAAARKQLGWNYPAFEIPAEYRAAWDQRAAGQKVQDEWTALYARYEAQHPEQARELARRLNGDLPADWLKLSANVAVQAAAIASAQATRQSSQFVLNLLGPSLGELVGGSADLTGSNNTFRKDSQAVLPHGAGGNYINYGVREFGMTAIMNGLYLHGGFRPYGGTFLTFSDYARNAVRMAALMRLGVILVYTHDSIGLGEDGPTHQPIEHVSSLRLMPQLSLWRPCDAAETAVAWIAAIERSDGPTALVLTRQALPPQPRDTAQAQAIHRGGYTLVDCAGQPEAIVIATGSEVSIAVEAAKALATQGRRIRVVSMPCVDAFDNQDAEWREAVLPASVTCRVAIEAGATGLWWRHVGSAGKVLGLDHFGASGKAPELFRQFGLTAENLQRTIVELLS
jgi:transketolase